MIALLDVCSGNLRSVERALMHVGGDVQVTKDPDAVRKADKIVVPGQGAFGVFMRGLAERGLGEALLERVKAGVPYFGICLGLQVLFEHSQEGDCAGLSVLKGRVRRLVPGDPSLKIPHMGWNTVRGTAPGIDDGAYVYFVHSYVAVPTDPSQYALVTRHGVPFCAAVKVDNIFACQFHPEKSQALGLKMLEAFVKS